MPQPKAVRTRFDYAAESLTTLSCWILPTSMPAMRFRQPCGVSALPLSSILRTNTTRAGLVLLWKMARICVCLPVIPRTFFPDTSWRSSAAIRRITILKAPRIGMLSRFKQAVSTLTLRAVLSVSRAGRFLCGPASFPCCCILCVILTLS